MIFSAGLGTRFKPWTDKHPKALALVNGKTLLQRNVEYLRQFGIRRIVVNVHHFADQIIDIIREQQGWGCEILISDETDRLLETGGGLLKARPFLEPAGTFVTLNVDILTNLDLYHLLEYHEKQQALISFGVTNRASSRKLLFDASMRLAGWKNESTGETRMAVSAGPSEIASLKALAYSCVVVFDARIFGLIRQQGKFSIIDTYLDLATDHKIMGFDHTGDHLVDVGRPASIAEAERAFT